MIKAQQQKRQNILETIVSEPSGEDSERQSMRFNSSSFSSVQNSS
jgi:ribulose bisphosphate carboxylase small subunit